MSFFFAMKKGDDDENKFSPPTPKIIEPLFVNKQQSLTEQLLNFIYFTLSKNFKLYVDSTFSR